MNPNKTNHKQIVKKARQRFGVDLFAQNYAQIHADDQHLADMLKLCQPVAGKKYLDLGTGNGYVAFELARQSSDISVTGLDIVAEAVQANNQKAKAEKYPNLDFVSYDGVELPFNDNEFFGVLSRYAFHHFPNPALSARETARILQKDGFCLIADPAADKQDKTDFINHFAGLKDDGHVRFYPQDEIEAFFVRVGFSVEKQFTSSVTFPRQMNENYKRLIEQTPPEILALYQLQIKDSQVYVTVQVLNTLFRHSG
jgi:ubiquinone/menaquinone biosynthesis C-methylase UbiE